MIYLSILEKLPKKLAHSLIRFAPPSFQSKERIVRHIYTPLNININTRQLKPNFLQFRFNEKTRKNELSCNRLEFDSLKNLRAIGIKKWNAFIDESKFITKDLISSPKI